MNVSFVFSNSLKSKINENDEPEMKTNVTKPKVKPKVKPAKKKGKGPAVTPTVTATDPQHPVVAVAVEHPPALNDDDKLQPSGYFLS